MTITKRILILALTTLAIPLSAIAGSWNTSQQSIGGMNVWIYTPDSVSPVGNGRSAMIVLHGCAQSATDMKTGANLEVAADQYGMVMAVPDAPGGGVGIYGCWDYYDSNHTRSNRHNDNLIALGQYLQGRSDVDPDQVYISGLSSGATQSQVTACLAPDVFAGVGSTGGPTMGTAESQAFVKGGSASTAASLCNSWAGSNKSLLATQMWNIAHGTSDGLVPYAYAEQNIDAIEIFKSISQTGSNSLQGATETVLGTTNKATKLDYTGMDHRWAAGGSTGGGTYIDHSTSRINYATYLANFFMNNNQRYDRNQGPSINSVTLSSSADRITVNANISDAEGSVASATATIFNAVSGAQVGSINLSAAGGNQFTGDSASLANNLYRVDVTASDNEGATGATVSDTVRVGPAPAATAPALSNTAVSVTGQCATVSGNVVDINENLSTVIVAFDSGNVTATVSGTSYSAEKCDLAGGSNSATITATDTTSLSSNDSVSFNVDAGITATLTDHINAGRLDYSGGYSSCYLEYSTAAFKLTEVPSGSQCRWQDDDASCTGPVQACTGSGGGTGGGTPDPDPQPEPDPEPQPEPTTCEEFTAYNYYHKTAGRAHSSGSYWSPSYYANGSNDPMAGSTWGSTTLHSEDGTNWNVGGC